MKGRSTQASLHLPLLRAALLSPGQPAWNFCPSSSSRAMAECGSAQIPGIFGEAALILSSEEDELKKMTALALVIEVRRGEGPLLAGRGGGGLSWATSSHPPEH